MVSKTEQNIIDTDTDTADTTDDTVLAVLTKTDKLIMCQVHYAYLGIELSKLSKLSIPTPRRHHGIPVHY